MSANGYSHLDAISERQEMTLDDIELHGKMSMQLMVQNESHRKTDANLKSQERLDQRMFTPNKARSTHIGSHSSLQTVEIDQLSDQQFFHQQQEVHQLHKLLKDVQDKDKKIQQLRKQNFQLISLPHRTLAKQQKNKKYSENLENQQGKIYQSAEIQQIKTGAIYALGIFLSIFILKWLINYH